MKQFIVLNIALLFSCNRGNIKFSEKNQMQRSSIERDIPKDKKGNLNFYYLISKNKAKQLKLENLENGCDSLEIRIWYDYFRRGNGRELVVLKNNQDSWSCKIYHLKVEESDFNLKTQNIIDYTIDNRYPKFGWNNFVSKIISFKILSLPDLESSRNFDEIVADGETYSFEIATKKKYRFYNYWSPQFIKDKYPEAKYAEEILKFVDQEFNFNGYKE